MSATDRRERRNHFRGKPRPGRRVEVEYQIGDAAPRRAFTRNVGIGGAFIVTPEPESPGTMLRLSLRVPTATDPVSVRAEVRWTSNGDGTPESLSGMGVKFLGLEVEELLQLNEYFASLTGTDDPAAP
jgi:hypothetical protein